MMITGDHKLTAEAIAKESGILKTEMKFLQERILRIFLLMKSPKNWKMFQFLPEFRLSISFALLKLIKKGKKLLQ